MPGFNPDNININDLTIEEPEKRLEFCVGQKVKLKSSASSSSISSGVGYYFEVEMIKNMDSILITKVDDIGDKVEVDMVGKGGRGTYSGFKIPRKKLEEDYEIVKEKLTSERGAPDVPEQRKF